MSILSELSNLTKSSHKQQFLFTQEYMMGDKNQSILPVAFSLMASFVSAIYMYGLSAEVYSRGTQFSIIFISYALATPVIGYVFLPVFFKLGNLSLYEVNCILSIVLSLKKFKL